MHEPLEGIAAADARLGRPFPLPTMPLPLARWVEVTAVGSGAEVAWNLDDTRAGAPGRLALYAGPEPPPARELHGGGAAAAPRAAGRRAGRGARRHRLAGRPAARGRAVPASRARAALDGRRAAP